MASAFAIIVFVFIGICLLSIAITYALLKFNRDRPETISSNISQNDPEKQVPLPAESLHAKSEAVTVRTIHDSPAFMVIGPSCRGDYMVNRDKPTPINIVISEHGEEEGIFRPPPVFARGRRLRHPIYEKYSDIGHSDHSA